MNTLMRSHPVLVEQAIVRRRVRGIRRSRHIFRFMPEPRDIRSSVSNFPNSGQQESEWLEITF